MMSSPTLPPPRPVRTRVTLFRGMIITSMAEPAAKWKGGSHDVTLSRISSHGSAMKYPAGLSPGLPPSLPASPRLSVLLLPTLSGREEEGLGAPSLISKEVPAAAGALRRVQRARGTPSKLPSARGFLPPAEPSRSSRSL